MPFFSIIIPTLNEEKYLPALLASLVKQTFRDFEVIVVDGKSDDRTVEYAKKFESKVPSLKIKISQDRNVSLQRNLGASIALGEYLIFFDADVITPHSYLKQLYKIINQKHYPILTCWSCPDSNDVRDQIISSVGNIGLLVGKFIEQPFAGGYTIVVQTAIFRQFEGFNQKLRLSEDHDLIQRLWRSGIRLQILRSPRIMVSFRRFRKYGYFAILKVYAQATVYTILKKPITKALSEYPMDSERYSDKITINKTNSLPYSLEANFIKILRMFLDL
jgi:glycosyltransferase involved in cell wall biosynthesis